MKTIAIKQSGHFTEGWDVTPVDFDPRDTQSRYDAIVADRVRARYPEFAVTVETDTSTTGAATRIYVNAGEDYELEQQITDDLEQDDTLYAMTDKEYAGIFGN